MVNTVPSPEALSSQFDERRVWKRSYQAIGYVKALTGLPGQKKITVLLHVTRASVYKPSCGWS